MLTEDINMKNLFNTKDLFRTKNLLLMISTAVFIITMGMMLFTVLMFYLMFCWMFGYVDLDVPSDLLCIYHDKEWVAGKTFEQVVEKYGPHDYSNWDYASECRLYYFQCIDEYFCVKVDSNGNVVGEAVYVDTYRTGVTGELNPHGLTEREKIYRDGADF